MTMLTGADVLRERIHQLMPAVRADLEDLVRIPSVSAAAFDRSVLDLSAARVTELLHSAGVHDVRTLSVPGSAPAVIGRRAAPAGAPTVLLYAHHDVQPPGPERDWESGPFLPVERAGRLYGRGAADDKAGVMAHIAALKALGDDLAVGVTVFVEGEEEIGSPTLAAFLAEHGHLLRPDVVIVADSANWKVGVPALTTTLRGLVAGVITVRTLEHGVHSGLFGGAVPDAMMATIRLLDTLWDEHGDLVLPGLVRTQAPALDYSESDLRADAGLREHTQLIGVGELPARLWTRPSLTIVGLDAPTVSGASNTLLSQVRVKFSMRIAPGQDPDAALAEMSAHLQAAAAFGAEVSVEPAEVGRGYHAATDSAEFEMVSEALSQAWGAAPVQIGVGGSIPIVAELIARYPQAVVLITGVEDPDSRPHGPNESLDLVEFERACLAEALFLESLAHKSRG